jgi:SGNH hydrolase-like domain, acetyltransferase AlgX
MSTETTDPTRTRATSAVLCAGWLLDGEEEGGRAVADESVVAGVVAQLEAGARACAEIGAHYLPALVPRKRDVMIGPSPHARELALELRARLRDVDGVELLDLFEVLCDACRHGSPYHRTDAHWNARGAFFAARALLKEARKRVSALEPLGLQTLWLRQLDGYLGTLSGVPVHELLGEELIAREHQAEPEQAVAIDAGRMHALRMPVEQELAHAGQAHVRLYTIPGRERGPGIALVGTDGATTALLPWLAERSGRTTHFAARELPLAQLEWERPRVVIQVLREAELTRAH